MKFFQYFTPTTYWLLFLMWSFIFAFYINRLRSKKINGQLIFTLLIILAIDAFRTLFESAYFGLWYTSLVGFLPGALYKFLERPEIVFFPKALNVLAAITVIVILIYRWIPQEESEKNSLKDLINKKTRELTKSNERLQKETQEHKQTTIELTAKTIELSDTVTKLEAEIKERKNAEQALRENERYLRAIYEAADNVAFVVTDLLGEDTKILDISSGAEKIFGYPRDEIIGKSVSILHPAEVVKDFPKLQAELKQNKKGYSGESTLIRKNGKSFPALFTLFPKLNSNGGLVGTIGVSIDITNLKKAEEEIIKQKLLFETMFNTIPDGVVITDTERVVQLANEGMDSTFGYHPDELVGKSTAILYADQEKYQQTGETVFTETTKKTKNFYITRYRDMNGREFSGETFGAKLFDENKQWIGNLGIMRDITEREQAEVRIQQGLKMESIGNLAGGIAHDFNNVLSSIIGFTELTLDEVEKGSSVEDNLNEVYSAGKRAKDLVKQILAFARQSDEEIRPIKPNLIAKEVLKFIRSSIPTTIEIKQRIDSNSLINGNTTQLHQILMNLCTNAAHAMEDKGGILEMGMKDIIIDNQMIGEILELKPGHYMEITVSDTGSGIDQSIVEKIFEPYFTTKEPGEGTGMGLALVHGIVESYRGKIKVESTLGKGTMFTLYLPITKKRGVETTYEFENLPLGTERILFVDDEISITKMGSRVLGQLGYSVTEKVNSLEALELFEAKPDDFDLVVTDVTMPHMTGDKLAIELIKIRADLPVILCSGYSKRISEETAEEIGIKAFAYKPVVKADLAKTVRKVLDDAKSKNQQ